MPAETPSIEVGAFFEGPGIHGGFVYKVAELICASRAKVAVYPWGLARENNQDLNSGDITLVAMAMLESIPQITRKRAKDIVGEILQ